MTIESKGGTSSRLATEVPARRSPGPTAVISVSWSSMAFSAGAIAIASTSSLAIIATLNRADALSTIALALAILSFIIQIGLFIAQSWTTGQQVLHSEEVNSDTRSVLAELRENARGTNQLISEQFEQVLGHLLDTTKRTVNESIKGQEAQVLNERLDRELRRTLQNEAASHIKSTVRTRERRPLTEEENNVLSILTTPISDPETLERANSAVYSLTPAAIADLNNFANDHVSTLKTSGVPGLFLSIVPHVYELVSAGLVQRSEPPEAWKETYPNQAYFTLTPKGLEVARVFTAGNSSSQGSLLAS
jgi:hypothetical protein